MTRLLRFITRSLVARVVITNIELHQARVKLRLERARANELDRRLRVHEEVALFVRESAAEAVRLERENAMMRGSLWAIAAGTEDPAEMAAKALGDAVESGAPEWWRNDILNIKPSSAG